MKNRIVRTALVAVASLLVLTGCEQAPPLTLAPKCPSTGKEVVVVDASSSQRSRPQVTAAAEALASSAARASICKTDWSGRAVAGGAVANIAEPAWLATPVGATEAGRRNNLAPRVNEIRSHFAAELDKAFSDLPADMSSLPAALGSAAEVADADTKVIVISDAVDQGTGGADLNRSLTAGEGAAAAAAVEVPTLTGADVVIAGVAQMDRKRVAAPGNAWATEINSYARTLCDRTGAKCRTYAGWDQTDLLG